MPTPRQEKLAEKLVENQLKDKPEPIGKVLESVGYAKSTADANSAFVIEQPGVQEALAERVGELESALKRNGVTPDKIAQVIAKLLNHDDYQANDKGITQVMKITGGYKTGDEQGNRTQINIQVINSPEVKQAVSNFEEELKKALTKRT